MKLINEGKKYGYYVKPSKSWLILKDPRKLLQAESLFEDSPINVTTDGKRHLGAAIGTEEFKTEFIEKKVEEWCKELTILSEIAVTQPHAAYSAYLLGEQHKFTYFIRTLSNISLLLQPLDDLLDNVFIPALFGCGITKEEREGLSLPIKDGGLGIHPINSKADLAYETSTKITQALTDNIVVQSVSLPENEAVKRLKSETRTIVRGRKTTAKVAIINKQSAQTKRSLEQTSEPGDSSWLGALPLQSQGFNLKASSMTPCV